MFFLTLYKVSIAVQKFIQLTLCTDNRQAMYQNVENLLQLIISTKIIYQQKYRRGGNYCD